MFEDIGKVVTKHETFPTPEVIVRRERDLERLLAARQRGVDFGIEDEEMLNMFAFAHNHPEFTDEILEQVKKYKSHIKESPHETFERVGKILEGMEESSPVEEEAQRLAKEWEGKTKEVAERTSRSVEYFRSHSTVDRVVLVSIENDEYSGRSFRVGGEAIIMSNPDNLDNVDHEFLHCILNPVIEDAYNKLSPKEQERLVELSGAKLRQDYGEYPLSLLNEEVIRTYNDFVKMNRSPATKTEFLENVSKLSPKDFEKERKGNESFQTRLAKLKIDSFDKFKERAGEYFDMFERDELRERTFTFYKGYADAAEADQGVTFERYFSERVRELTK